MIWWFINLQTRQLPSDQNLCLSLEYSLTVKLLTEHHLKFLSLKGGCIDWSESIHVKMPHCFGNLMHWLI